MKSKNIFIVAICLVLMGTACNSAGNGSASDSTRASTDSSTANPSRTDSTMQTDTSKKDTSHLQK